LMLVDRFSRNFPIFWSINSKICLRLASTLPEMKIGN
jgi:hypothetical protein